MLQEELHALQSQTKQKELIERDKNEQLSRRMTEVEKIPEQVTQTNQAISDAQFEITELQGALKELNGGFRFDVLPWNARVYCWRSEP